LRRPDPLQPGDRVALISPSSHQGRYPEHYLYDATTILEGWELQVSPLIRPEPRHLYLAGKDADRAMEFARHYIDPGVRALFITRGGYGAARMLHLLDANGLAGAPPKWIVGFSDATALFTYMHTMTGVATLHGPCLAAPGALTAERREETLGTLREALFNPAWQPEYSGLGVVHRPKAAPERLIGRLVGGCLSVLVTSLGTPWAVDTHDAILFLEDVDEAPYRIDRMLTHLRHAGAFEGLRAVVFGHLERCEGEREGLLYDMLRDVFANAPFPVLTGLPAGHGDPNLALPLGLMAAIHLPEGDEATATLVAGYDDVP